MDDNSTAEAPRPGTSLSRPMTKAGGPDQSTRPMTRYVRGHLSRQRGRALQAFFAMIPPTAETCLGQPSTSLADIRCFQN